MQIPHWASDFDFYDQLETFARRFLIPLIDIGIDVHGSNGEFSTSGQVMLSMPGKPCMRCMGLITDEALAKEPARYGAAGGKPQVVWPNPRFHRRWILYETRYAMGDP